MDYKKFNDNELIYLVQENDDSSSGILFKKYHPIILSLSQKYYERCIGYGCELDDFYQEGLISFYKAIKNYDSSKNVTFYSFFILCIKRSLASLVRKIYESRDSYLNNSGISINDLEYCLEDIRENPSARDSYKGLESIVKSVMYSLPIESSAIFELKINGFTYREIGILLDIPISSVEFKTRKARIILKNKIKAYYCK